MPTITTNYWVTYHLSIYWIQWSNKFAIISLAIFQLLNKQWTSCGRPAPPPSPPIHISTNVKKMCGLVPNQHTNYAFHIFSCISNGPAPTPHTYYAFHLYAYNCAGLDPTPHANYAFPIFPYIDDGLTPTSLHSDSEYPYTIYEKCQEEFLPIKTNNIKYKKERMFRS